MGVGQPINVFHQPVSLLQRECLMCWQLYNNQNTWENQIMLLAKTDLTCAPCIHLAATSNAFPFCKVQYYIITII